MRTTLTDIERRLKALQDQRKFGECERGPQRTRDGTEPETRIIGDHHLGPARRVKRDTVALTPFAARPRATSSASSASL
jgi:hypothetical protein